MQHHVDQMVTERVQTPEGILQPKDGVSQRIILLGYTWIQPDMTQAVD